MQLNILLNQRSKQHFELSKSSLNKKNVKHIDLKTHTHTHTHTHKTSLTNFIFQKQEQFSEHILAQVFLVMVKSHCIYTCIKSSKSA